MKVNVVQIRLYEHKILYVYIYINEKYKKTPKKQKKQ